LALGIVAAEVRCLPEIAGAARERQVVLYVETLERDGNDVLDLERKIEHDFGRMAVLTSMFRS